MKAKPLHREPIDMDAVDVQGIEVAVLPDLADVNGEAGTGSEKPIEALRGQTDPERLFAASIRKTRVLTRDAEVELAGQIVRARNRVRRVIRQARRITQRALSDAGRGVILPSPISANAGVTRARVCASKLRAPTPLRERDSRGASCGLHRRAPKSRWTHIGRCAIR
jgi:hypothetical protein